MPNSYVNKVVQSNGTTLIDISDTTAVASDVAEGKYFYLATGEKAEGTASGGGGGSTRTTIVPEQTANYSERYNQINFVAPLVVGEVYIYTIDGVESQSMAFDNYGSVAIGSPETTIGFEYANGTMYLSIADSSLRGTHTVKVEQESSGGGGSSATLITKTITENGTYSAEDDDADGYSEVTVNVPSGGSSKNVQTAQSTTRRNNTALGSVNSLTCSTAGTYDVYWTCARSNTSQTWGSQLYINGVAYGTENTAWSNNVQNNHLTGVVLAANDTVAVYGRSRSGYYIHAPQLTIVQTA